MTEGNANIRSPTEQQLVEEKNIDDAAIITEEEIKAGGKKVEAAPKVAVPEGWKPKTDLGKQVYEGKITDIFEIFKEGTKIAESEIVDVLIPNLENEIIMIGGSSGKGGGKRRTVSRRTTRMHKSGRRYRVSVMVAVGNRNGYLGLGIASGPPNMHREVVKKALHQAKLSIIPITRGCGSWECGCGTPHSVPVKTIGKQGSVEVAIIPAPKGVGLCVSNEIKKIMRLAGIKDVWMKTKGHTETRCNFADAVFLALKKINTLKITEDQKIKIGAKMGRID